MTIASEWEPNYRTPGMLHKSGLEELKTWVHVFSCTTAQVCVHVVHSANFVHVNNLCVHACTWLCNLGKYFPDVVLSYLILH